MEAEGDVHIPDLTGSSSYQDIAAEEEQQEFYTDWAQLLQSKVGNSSYCSGNQRISNAENPPNCAGGICELPYIAASLFVSRFPVSL